MGNSRRTGLTLVESLFAISALAILFIQAVPAAQRARSDARLVLCQQRMGGIARASLIYAGQDANDLVIPIAYRDSTSPRHDLQPDRVWGKERD
jgi:type II secretory pathway pseudopilin PulG